MKKLLKILGGIFAVFIILVIALLIWLDAAVLKGFNNAVPAALGVPASLEDASIRPLRGKLTLKGLHIGNPKGYKTDGLLDLGTLYIRYDTASALTDTIIINEILIDDLVVTYEKGLRNSNLGALLDQLSSEEDGEKEAKAEKEEKSGEEKPSKKVIIEKLTISHSKMNLSLTGAMGTVFPLPLAGSGKLIGQGIGAVGDGATAAGGAAMDAGKAVGGAVGDAGKAATEALKGFNPFGK